jgi:hypothetical protein
MRFRPIVAAATLAWLLTACAPTFNWRDVSIDNTAVTALFPCKPETVIRTLPLAGTDQKMTMRSCDASGLTFALAHAHLPDPLQAPTVLTRWRETTLEGLRADPASVSRDTPQGLPALPLLSALRASRGPDSASPLALQGLWFAHGGDVFAAFVMGPTLPPGVRESFFSGLRLR